MRRRTANVGRHKTAAVSRRRTAVSRRRKVGAIILGALLILLAFSPPLVHPASAEALAQAYNYAPSTRTLTPVSVAKTEGKVTPHKTLPSKYIPVRISGRGSYVTFDFAREVGGIITLTFSGSSKTQQDVGLAFTESSEYIGTTSDLSSGGSGTFSLPGTDGALTTTVKGKTTYTVPAAQLRGGFRYLTVFMASSGYVELSGVSLDYTASPEMSDPKSYTNYFYSNDSLLNQIWYAGAYTVQMDTISSDQGRVWGPPVSGWQNDAIIGAGADTVLHKGKDTSESTLVDGAKRDRTVWPGDIGISLPTAYVSTDDLASTRNALTELYEHQNLTTGELPWAGPPVNYTGSDTYHLWTLLNTSTYYTYSDDTTWLKEYWSQYELGMKYILAKVNSSGLLNVTGTSDWGRADQGGENIEANALLYAVLTQGAILAGVENDTAEATSWTNTAATLKTAANAILWNPTVGLYRDNPTSTLYPQDGNSLAVWYGLTDSAAQNTSITQGLSARWNMYGALTPEDCNDAKAGATCADDGGQISTFAGSMEIMAHFVAGDDTGALALIRREWGYMLDSPLGTASTFWEGYQANGDLTFGPYTSLAHGWATGATSALTNYVLGLTPQTATGKYSFIPHAGDLTNVDGDITMPQGKVQGSWNYNASGSSFTENLTSPAGTTGTIGVPTYGSSNVTVTLNGVTVWSAGRFIATAGVSGGSTDGKYIYLNGVAPGTYSVSATGVQAPTAFAASVAPSQNQLPAGYTYCATQGGTCTPSGTQVMAYGAGKFAYAEVNKPTTCSNSSFGGTDPTSGILNACYLAPTGGPDGYSACATNGGTCSFSGTREVAYGTNGAFRFQVATSSVKCTAETFGTDPAPGTAESCYVAPTGPPPGNWTSCATEKSSCAATGSQPMLFGADGGFWTGTTNGSTSCGVVTVGIDPAYGVAKSCYTWRGPPAGFTANCAAENGTCSFTGQQTVAFGADGDYVYKTATGTIPCTDAAFGSNPLPNVTKACYLVR